MEGGLRFFISVRIPYGMGKVVLAASGFCCWTFMKTPVAGSFGAAETSAARRELKKRMNFIFA